MASVYTQCWDMWAGTGLSGVMCTGHYLNHEALGNKAGRCVRHGNALMEGTQCDRPLVMLVVAMWVIIHAVVIDPSLDCLFLRALFLCVVNMEVVITRVVVLVIH